MKREVVQASWKLALGLLWAVTSPVGTATATDFSGIWQLDRPQAREGVRLKTFLMLEQHGDELTGSVVINNAVETPLHDVVVTDDQVEFRDGWNFRYVLTRPPGHGAPTIQLFFNPKAHATFEARAATREDASPPARIPPEPMIDLPADGLARTPPMGWNSWNRFGGRIDDATVREVADAMVASGLRDAGYVYVVIDDTWSAGRDDEGNLQPNAKFPDMKALGDYLHERGLKFGIYSSPGAVTCGGYPGSYGYEVRDAQTFAGWGVDYLKYDWCGAMRIYSLEEQPAVYQRMARALRATGRPIVFSICQYGVNDPWIWGPMAGGHLWRTTDDIADRWASVDKIGFNQSLLAAYAGPGHWNDPDMLEIGNGGLNEVESRTHFTLWCLLAAPLMAGNDVRNMSPETIAILTQRELIAIDQDPLGEQARRVFADGHGIEIWTRRLANGDVAAGVFNRGDTATTWAIAWDRFGFTTPPSVVRDLRAKTNWDPANVRGPIELPAHGCAALRISPRSGE